MVPRGAFEGLSPWSQVANVVAAIEEVDPCKLVGDAADRDLTPRCAVHMF